MVAEGLLGNKQPFLSVNIQPIKEMCPFKSTNFCLVKNNYEIVDFFVKIIICAFQNSFLIIDKGLEHSDKLSPREFKLDITEGKK